MADELRILQAQADLAEGKFVRKDGRTFNAHRPLEVTLGPIKTADGSCLVRLGNTCVVCGLRGEIAEKQLADPFQDINVSVQAQLPFKNIGSTSGPSEEEQALSQRLQDILLAAGAFPVRDISSRYAWVLHVTVTCLDADGNLLAAALVAIAGALATLRLPAAFHQQDEGGDASNGDSQEDPITAQLEQTQLIVGDNYEQVSCELPIGVTFGVINSELVVDLTREEEMLAGGESCVVLDGQGNVVHLAKLGGAPIPAQHIAIMMTAAKDHAAKLRKTLLLAQPKS